jgi:hypothetical protein
MSAFVEHLKLELEIDRMSGDERKAAADALRRALGLLEKGGQGQVASCPLLALSGHRILTHLMSLSGAKRT